MSRDNDKFKKPGSASKGPERPGGQNVPSKPQTQAPDKPRSGTQRQDMPGKTDSGQRQGGGAPRQDLGRKPDSGQRQGGGGKTGGGLPDQAGRKEQRPELGEEEEQKPMAEDKSGEDVEGGDEGVLPGIDKDEREDIERDADDEN